MIVFSQDFPCLADRFHFEKGDFRCIDTSLSKGPKPTIGIQVDLVRIEVTQSLLHSFHNLSWLLHRIRSRVNYPQANLLFVPILFEDLKVSGPGSSKLQDQLVNIHLHEVRKKRPVISFEEDILPTAPVSPAHVDTKFDPGNSPDGFVH